jgi:transposase-like protein
MLSKKGRRRYSEKFKGKAVALTQEWNNITALARHLGIDRKMLYQWKWQQEGRATRKPLPFTTKAAERGRWETLRRENEHLKRRLAERSLEVDFFKGALQKVEARHRSNTGSGETPSTSASASGRSHCKAH